MDARAAQQVVGVAKGGVCVRINAGALMAAVSVGCLAFGKPSAPALIGEAHVVLFRPPLAPEVSPGALAEVCFEAVARQEASLAPAQTMFAPLVAVSRMCIYMVSYARRLRQIRLLELTSDDEHT